MLSTTLASKRKDSRFDVDPTAYRRIMHAHTRAQLAAATSPPAVSASPSVQSSAPAAPAKVTTPDSIPAVAPPQANESPVASRQTTIIKEASPKSVGSNSSGGYSGQEDGEGKKSPADFDAGRLYIPIKVRSSPAGGAGAVVGKHGVEDREGRRKSEGGFATAIVGRDWGRREEGMGVIAEGAGRNAGEDDGRRGSADSLRHADTRLRCDCDDCEGCRTRKGLLARNGLCMTDPSALMRRETV